MQTLAPDGTPSPGGGGDNADPATVDRRQHLEREESTTSYPIIGDGYSDTISVVSDITTPTVMPGQVVPLEEHYLGPPMQIGFSRKAAKEQLRRPSEPKSGGSKHEQNNYNPSASKTTYTNTTNTSSRPKPIPEFMPPSPTPPQPQPQPPVVAKPGGAAAKRRLNYQITMAQLEATVGSSLLRKSSKYAASVSATAASMQAMTLAGTNNANANAIGGGGSGDTPGKERIRMPRRLTDATTSSVSSPTSPDPGFATKSSNNNNNNNNTPQGFANFNAVVVETKRSNGGHTTPTGSSKGFDGSGFSNSGFGAGNQEMHNFFVFNDHNDDSKGNNNNLFDQDGFPVSVDGSHDPFAISSFGNDFPQDAYNSNVDAFATDDGKSFFPASTKDSAKRKKGSSSGSGGGSSHRRSSVGKKKDDVKDSEEKVRKRK